MIVFFHLQLLRSLRAPPRQTGVKLCIRSSTGRCRRNGSQPTVWSSRSPTSACEYYNNMYWRQFSGWFLHARLPVGVINGFHFNCQSNSSSCNLMWVQEFVDILRFGFSDSSSGFTGICGGYTAFKTCLKQMLFWICEVHVLDEADERQHLISLCWQHKELLWTL